MPNGLGIILVKISSFFSLLLQIFSFSLYLVSHSVLLEWVARTRRAVAADAAGTRSKAAETAGATGEETR